MNQIIFNLIRISSVVLAATFLVTGNGVLRAQTARDLPAETTSNRIQRTDPSFQTLKRLGTKYECLPEDSTILTGKRSTVTRKVFISNLNTCLQTMEELVAKRQRKPVDTGSQADNTQPQPPAPGVTTEAAEPEVTQQDLDAVKALIAQYDRDLNALEDRIKKSSFSTTTKLKGEAIINAAGYGGARGANANSIIFSNRVRLNLVSSLTGKDRLLIRLQSQNTPSFNGTFTGTNMTRLGYDGDSANATSVSLLQYDFPVGDDTTVRVATTGYEINDNSENFNSLLASSGTGAISRYGRFNPILRINNNNGAAFVVSHKFSKEFSFDASYFAANANVLGANSGVFNGSNAILGQLTFRPSQELSLGLIYGHSYDPSGTNLTGSTGSTGASSPFGGTTATTANHYSVAASYKISPNAVLSGWAGFIDAQTVAGNNSANISDYAITLAFPDFGGNGNVLAFVAGIPPKLNSIRNGTADPSTSYHLEALYKLNVTDNISVTPGIFVITSPNHNSANPTEYVGAVRTTLKF